MKPAVFKKTAQVTVLMMFISALLPVLAFAATGFKDVVYRNNSVSGSVYSDVYSVNAQVYLYDPNGNYVGTASSATYSVYNGVYTYDFSLNNVSSYSYLKLKEKVTDSVYYTVYNSNSGRPGGGGGGGGGGGIISGPSINVPSDGSIDAYTLENALNNNDIVELVLSGDVALIPAKVLAKFTGDTKKALKIKNDKGSYMLPIHVLKLDDLAGKLSVSVDDMKIKVSISAASEAAVNGIKNAATALGATVVSGAVDFNLAAVGTGDKTQAVDLGNNYISRTLPLSKAVNPATATAVVYDPNTQKLSFVPALFSSSNESNEAVIKRNSNSIYTVIELSKSFEDVKGHWAQSYINLLANKLVVDGVTDTSFEPERNITRAEFAALVVRSLGLDQSAAASSSFKDVSSSEWYASVVASAVNAKIIDGYEDNTFKPNQAISREELAAMVVRALAYAGAKPDVSADRQSELLAKFKDSSKIVWAQNELAVAIEAGIVDGMTDTTIEPSKQATRAQSATMLNRLLTKANFIN
ncbi:S-layer homology domain-containing protein [Paenibacillus sp. NPDC056579]|uniref:S-layer homology domain-containing protein n=1 Tax=Paenibacillus sp. NPDC056579 TaxID=3345871 RepID=UPI00368DB4B0